MTKQLGFKITLEKIIQIIKDGFESVKAPEDAIIYKAINDEKIDENELKNGVMDINAIKLKNKNMTKKIENATKFI